MSMDFKVATICDIYYKTNIAIRDSLTETIFWQNDCFFDAFDRIPVFNVLSLQKIPYGIRDGQMWIEDKVIHDINGKEPWVTLTEYHREYMVNFGSEKRSLLYLLDKRVGKKSPYYLYENDNYTYMRIEDFDAVRAKTIVLNADKTLILDLRGNLGGNITSMIAVLKLFVDGTLFYLRHKNEKYCVVSKECRPAAYKRIYALVDEQTASSAEIFVQVLKERLGATVVGQCTYGKWVVHRVICIDYLYIKIPQYIFVSNEGFEFGNYEGIAPDLPMNDMSMAAFLKERLGEAYEQV